DLGDRYLPSGALELVLPDLGPLAALGLGEIAGAVKGKLEFTTEEGSPAIRLEAAANEFKRDAVQGRGLSIDVVISDYLSSPVIGGRVRADEIVSGGTVVSGIDVKLAQEGSWTRFDGGATVSGVPARAAGRARFAEGMVAV